MLHTYWEIFININRSNKFKLQVIPLINWVKPRKKSEFAMKLWSNIHLLFLQKIYELLTDWILTECVMILNLQISYIDFFDFFISAPEKQLELFHTRYDMETINITCRATGIYPEPEIILYNDTAMYVLLNFFYFTFHNFK